MIFGIFFPLVCWESQPCERCWGRMLWLHQRVIITSGDAKSHAEEKDLNQQTRDKTSRKSPEEL